MTTTTPSSPWEGASLLSSYSRADALADGTLIDISAATAAVGIRCPVAITPGVLAEVGTDDAGQLARLTETLRVAAGLARNCDADRIDFHMRGWTDE